MSEMLKVIFIVSLAFLAACSQSVSPSEFEKAHTLCESNEGIRIVVFGVFLYEVWCNNGAMFDVGRRIRRDKEE